MQDLTIKKIKFTIRVVLIHTISYMLCGLILHQIFDYAAIFEIDVIKNFMRPVSDPLAMLGPWLQPIRGLLFALGLWLFRPVWIKKKLGWLYIWALIFIFGILNTPAAAPSSIEGFLYSRLPIWYHFMGYVEVGVQTLIFSVLVFSLERAKENEQSLWQRFPHLGEIVRAIALSCFAYIGYAVGSIALLFITGSTLEFKETTIALGAGANVINIQEAAGDLTIQFMFLAVFILNAVFIWFYNYFLKNKKIVVPLLFGMIMVLNIIGIVVYQLLFSELMPVLMLLFITLLPTLILTFCLKKDVFSLAKKEN